MPRIEAKDYYELQQRKAELESQGYTTGNSPELYAINAAMTSDPQTVVNAKTAELEAKKSQAEQNIARIKAERIKA